LHLKFCQVLEKEGFSFVDPAQRFKSSFELLNEDMQKLKLSGGSTAVVAYFKGPELFLANVGDSRAVLCQNDGKALRVTTDHKPDLPAERERIEKSGGWIKNGAITGTLAVSRALGDFSYKPFISCEPDVFGPFRFLEESLFLILACDGLWDVVTDEEAVEMVLNSKNPEDAAVKLRDRAVKAHSKDNISVLVIFFPQFHPPGSGGDYAALVPSTVIKGGGKIIQLPEDNAGARGPRQNKEKILNEEEEAISANKQPPKGRNTEETITTRQQPSKTTTTPTTTPKKTKPTITSTTNDEKDKLKGEEKDKLKTEERENKPQQQLLKEGIKEKSDLDKKRKLKKKKIRRRRIDHTVTAGG
jgi:serine/threonine protein phosphatase PrpC